MSEEVKDQLRLHLADGTVTVETFTHAIDEHAGKPLQGVAIKLTGPRDGVCLALTGRDAQRIGVALLQRGQRHCRSCPRQTDCFSGPDSQPIECDRIGHLLIGEPVFYPFTERGKNP